MSWQAFGVIVALVGVIVTLLLNLRAQRQNSENLRLNREGLDLAKLKAVEDEKAAAAAAGRSEAAARLTEEYSRRIVDALEAIAAGSVVGVVPAVKWELVRTSKDGYRLTNVGDLTAFAVVVSSHESLDLIEVPDEPVVLQSGEAIGFYAAVTMGTSDMTITVSWADEDGQSHSWRYPLPYNS